MSLLWVSVLLFFINHSLCDYLLHAGRSKAGQGKQDTRLATIVGKHKKIIRIRIIDRVGIVNYTLKALPIAFLMPSEAVPTSSTAEFSYH